MITLIHGDNISASRSFFTEQKEKLKDSTTYDGDQVTIPMLAQILEGGMLFSDTKDIFIENLFSRKRTNQLVVKNIASYLVKHEEHTNIVIWEDGQLTQAQLKQLPKAKVYVFNLPKNLFAFLDSFVLVNSEKKIKLFHEALGTVEPELVFFMMVRQLRILLSLSSKNKEIDEVKNLKSWQIGKLMSVIGKLSKEQLITVHNKLFQIDLATKTGTTPLTISQSIDFFLLEI